LKPDYTDGTKKAEVTEGRASRMGDKEVKNEKERMGDEGRKRKKSFYLSKR